MYDVNENNRYSATSIPSLRDEARRVGTMMLDDVFLLSLY